MRSGWSTTSQRLEVLAAACRWLDTRIITLCTGTRDPEDMWKWHPENVRREHLGHADCVDAGGRQDRRPSRGDPGVRARDPQRGQLGRQGPHAARRGRLAVAQGRDRPGEPDASRRTSPRWRKSWTKRSTGSARTSSWPTRRIPPTGRDPVETITLEEYLETSRAAAGLTGW